MGGKAVGGVFKLGLGGKGVPIGEHALTWGSLTRGLVFSAVSGGLPRT
jgi:hypothetical protein